MLDIRPCDGSIRDPYTNPLGKSLGYQFALFTTNPSEEEIRDMQTKYEHPVSGAVVTHVGATYHLYGGSYVPELRPRHERSCHS
ncbi:hypothetical protein TNCV_426301 [Trichonephila clavipes]|nr:hypothetical protein TNCV_426301 [Trichonephila clavipes]